jgi:hypothetical protein
MIYFIKKIFNDKIDDSVHSQFTRFSRGVFDGKAILNISRNGKIKISSSYELADDLINFMASLTKHLEVSGIILARENIEGLQGGKKRGLMSYQIDKEISSEQLDEISKKAYFMLVDCSAPGIDFKTKKTIPRPSTKSADKVNDKFCTAQIDLKFWPAVKEEFLFNLPEGKKYRIINKYEINEIIMPQNEKDFEKLRLLAKRKGKIIRKVIVDDKEIIQEKGFTA